MNFRSILLGFFLLLTQLLFAQNKIQLVNAGELEGVEINGKSVRILKKNVIFKEGKTMMYCDSASQIADKNAFDAYYNVKIEQGKTVMTGDKLNYNADDKRAIISGNVILREGTMTLTTTQLDYDMHNKNVKYNSFATIVDDGVKLTSNSGFYNSDKKTMTFYGDVKMDSNKDGKWFSMRTDTLVYHPRTKMAYFYGPTTITSQDGVLVAEKGQYDTEKQKAVFEGRSKIETPDYIIVGDFLNYDKLKKEGIARKNVELISKKDSVVIEGEYALYRGQRGVSKVSGHPVMRIKAGKDTLFLKADTLIAVSDSIKNQRMVKAFKHVKLYSKDFQASCDSLVYNYVDSTIHLFKDPILWANKTQITADSVRIHMANSKISRLVLRRNSFMILQDSINNYNQVRGKFITCNFINNEIRRVDVVGSGECIYFATENDTLLVGMNRVICTNMLIKFAPDNKIQGFSFITEPDAKFFPPQDMMEPDKKLRGFRWRIKDKPSRDTMRRPKSKK